MDSHSTEEAKIGETLPSLYKAPKWFLLLGVAWPTGTILFELLTRACTEEIFDPLPTFFHVILALTVPLANALAIWVDRGPITRFTHAVRALRGAAWISGLVYGLAFVFISIPAFFIAPIAIFMIFSTAPAAGLIAPATLGPMLGLLMLWRSSGKLKVVDNFRHRLGKSEPKEKRWAWLGAFACVALWVVAEGPMLITRGILESTDLARSEDKIRATRWLRSYGSEASLRAICYRKESGIGKNGPIEWIATGAAQIFIESPLKFRNVLIAPQMYYRAFGRTFDSLPPPFARKGLISTHPSFRHRENSNRGEVWDSGRGGDDIGPMMRGLALSTSRLDWNVDVPSRLAYGEWTLEFRNDHTAAHEARFHMLLPPGAVVSRLTLWVNGEEREAAFAGKAKVKAAYRQVVTVERRDPVMVNMIAPDRVMTQCFPVPPSGTMKIRLGMTTPVHPDQGRHLKMPLILERNFFLPSDLTHQVWVQSKSTFQISSGEQSAPQKAGPHIWQSGISEEKLQTLSVKITPPEFKAGKVWTFDKLATGPEKYLIRSPAEATHPPALKQLIVVVDSSAAISRWKDELKDLLTSRPERILHILVARDEGFLEMKESALNSAWDDLAFEGGIDNLPALQRATTLALGAGADVEVLWIHGPQAFEFPGAEALDQILERAPSPPKVHSIQLESGRHYLLERLFKHTALHANTREHEFEDSEFVKTFWTELEHPVVNQWVYSRSTSPPTGVEAGTEVWDHLARFEAYERVLSGFKGSEKPVPELAALAAQYQLVTPVSGAVVLETQQQYDRAGLKPIDPKAAANFGGGAPEPTRVLLLGTGLLLALLRRRRF